MLSHSESQDHVLFGLMKSGDEGAFREIYERYFGLLYVHAYRKLQHKDEAQDVIQEVFAVLWDKRELISLPNSLPAYLYTAVRNRIFNNFSRKQIESKYIQSLQNFIDQGICQTDHLVRVNQLNELIEKEIAALPPKMREIFSLSRKAHLTHRQIAVALNLSDQTVKKQVNNALRILRTRLGLLMFVLLLHIS